MNTLVPLFKHPHMLLALISMVLFIYRWTRALGENPQPLPRWLKIVPHLNDTLLIVTGLTLMVLMQINPGQQPWLMPKLIGLVCYIALGALALKLPGHGQKLMAGVAALVAFGYIVAVAITKSPLFF